MLADSMYGKLKILFAPFCQVETFSGGSGDVIGSTSFAKHSDIFRMWYDSANSELYFVSSTNHKVYKATEVSSAINVKLSIVLALVSIFLYFF
jgi:hypothetical protein